MKRIKKTNLILLIILFVAILLFVIYISKKIYDSNKEKGSLSAAVLEEIVSFELSDIGSDVYEVIIDGEDVDTFSSNYQEVVDSKIMDLMIVPYTFEEPFLIIDPYNTNTTAINIYFADAGTLEYTVHVDDSDIEDYTNTLNATSVESNNAYTMIGLMAGYKNKVTMTLTDDEGNTQNKEFTFDLSSIENSGEVIQTLEVIEGDSINELEDGLYAVLGHDKNFNADIYLYDNDGILRSELNLEDYRADRIIFYNDNLIYSSNYDELIEVNSLGKIEKTYYLGNYEMHHDYILDEDNNTLLVLASKKDSETIEDMIISVNLEDGTVKELVDMKDLLPELYENAFHPEENDYGGEELDWVHLNSIDFVSDDEIVVSARELSSIITIKNIYTNPEIDYIIADSSMYENSTYKDLLYTKNGDFTSQAGQHTVVYESDESLEDGKYFLYMYNNNYGGSRTLPDFDFSNYPGVGSYTEGDNSYYYKYLVDTNNKTYELVKKVNLDYSSIVSSTQELDDNLITSSGKNHVYAEYDNDGDLIKKFTYTSKKFAYRVFKYDFNDYWFSEVE